MKIAKIEKGTRPCPAAEQPQSLDAVTRHTCRLRNVSIIEPLSKTSTASRLQSGRHLRLPATLPIPFRFHFPVDWKTLHSEPYQKCIPDRKKREIETNNANVRPHERESFPQHSRVDARG